MEGPLPVTQADAVVIGAGAFGLSTAISLPPMARVRSWCWTALLPDRRPRLAPPVSTSWSRPTRRSPAWRNRASR